MARQDKSINVSFYTIYAKVVMSTFHFQCSKFSPSNTVCGIAPLSNWPPQRDIFLSFAILFAQRRKKLDINCLIKWVCARIVKAHRTNEEKKWFLRMDSKFHVLPVAIPFIIMHAQPNLFISVFFYIICQTEQREWRKAVETISLYTSKR